MGTYDRIMIGLMFLTLLLAMLFILPSEIKKNSDAENSDDIAQKALLYCNSNGGIGSIDFSGPLAITCRNGDVFTIIKMKTVISLK